MGKIILSGEKQFFLSKIKFIMELREMMSKAVKIYQEKDLV